MLVKLRSEVVLAFSGICQMKEGVFSFFFSSSSFLPNPTIFLLTSSHLHSNLFLYFTDIEMYPFKTLSYIVSLNL